ncbi:MAG: RadC family protein [Acidobacteriota bacterium]
MHSALPDHFPTRRLFDTGWEALSTLELLALLVGPGVSERQALEGARRLLEHFGSWQRLKDAEYGELRRAGLNHKKTLAVMAAARLFPRLDRVSLVHHQRFGSSFQIFLHFRPLVEGLKKEIFWAALLDGKNRIMKIERISEGTLNTSLVHPREVFRPAVREAAAGVLFIHNHPSGDPAPSEDDVRSTQRLVRAGKIVGIHVLDHVIIGDSRYFSFSDRGLLQDYERSG